MSSTIGLVVQATDRASPELHQVAESLAELGDESEKSAAEVAAASQSVGKYAKTLDRQGDAAKGAAQSVKSYTQSTTLAGQASKAVTSAIGTAAAAYLSLGAAVAAVRASYDKLIIQNAQLGDEIAKQSTRLGIGVESLTELRFAAVSGGVGVDQLEDSLKTLSKSAAESTMGNQGMAEAFEILGVNVKDASGQIKPVDALLRDVSDGLLTVDDEATRTTLAMRVFGEVGQKLTPIIEGGSTALASQAERAREVGAVWSEDTARAAEDVTQAMTDFGVAVDNITQRISADLFPAISGLLNSVLIPTANFISSNLDPIMGTLRDTILGIVPGANMLATAVGFLADDERELAEETKAANAELEQQGVNLISAAEGLRRLDEADRKASEARRRRQENRQKAIRENQDFERENERRQREAAANLAADDARQAAADQAAHDDEVARVQAMLDARIQTLNAELAAEDAAIAKRIERDQAYAEAARTEAAAIDSAMANAAVNMGAAFGQTFADVATGAKSGEEAMKALAKVAIQQAINIAQQAIAAAIARGTTEMSVAASTGAAQAIAAHSSIPFVGLQIGLAAAGAIVAAIFASQQFAEGGVVTGGTPGKDSVPALLMPGEVVLPVSVVRRLRGVFGDTGASSSPAPLPMQFRNGGVVPRGGGIGDNISLTVNVQTNTIPDPAQTDRFVRDIIGPSIERLRRAGM